MTIVARSLYKTYKNGAKEVRALSDINIDIKEKESIAIIGPSGAGKSTLLHLLGGLDVPSKGKVLLDEVDIYGLSEYDRARLRNIKVGFVFQFYHLLPEFNALENVMLPGMIMGSGFGVRGSGIRDRANEVLKAVGLERRLTHRPTELSGGESQRVAIARALVNKPQILLCDEPTGNLDSKTSQSIYDLLFELKSSMTLVIVTHDERVARRVDRVIHIKDGHTG